MSMEDEEEEEMVQMGSYKPPVRLVRDPSEEILLLWSLQQPTLFKQNAMVRQSSLNLNLEACGQRLSISQSPSSMSTPGVTGAVMWDSGVVLAMFLEHAVDSGSLLLQSKKVVELGSGCGLVGCIAALLGAQAILTDLPDRLRLLKKNVEANVNAGGDSRGSATVDELTWGDDPHLDLVDPQPDYGRRRFSPIICLLTKWLRIGRKFFSAIHAQISMSLRIEEGKSPILLASDVIYSEGAVADLLETLGQLCGIETTIFLTGELRNDVVLEYFLELAMKEFVVGRVDHDHWHAEYRSNRVVMLVLVKKSEKAVKG